MPELTPPALAVRDLRFRYAADPGTPWIVDVPSLELARGEQVLVSGASGGGKSTLLHLVAGLLEPSSGTVEVGGRPITGMRPAERDLFRGRAIGMIFQTFNLLHGFTARENVMMAMVVSDIPPRVHRDRAAALLAELGIERADDDPDRMSVGQRQRVAVARAIACNPVLVLADEPTASLDPAAAATAMDLIQRSCAKHDAALLCTSHDPSMRSRFERCIELEELATTTSTTRASTAAP